CKVMRTLASVEIEIMLILGLPCCLSSSVRCFENCSACCLENFVDSRRMSTLVFVDPESPTQADGAQSSRVPVSLPEDPYEAIRQAYLDGTDTESDPFKDPIDIKTPELPLIIAPPTSLLESTPPALVPILRRTSRMAVRAPPVMSSGLSASMAEVAAMSEFAFRKRFRSSYESSPSVSPPDLPSRKHYWGTFELVEDSEEDDDEEDEEIEESIDSNSVSEDTEDEGSIAEDEDPAAEDEGLAAGVEGLGTDDKSYSLYDEGRGLDDEGHGVESHGLGLEEEGWRQELALEKHHVYSTFKVGQGSGSAPEYERPQRVSASRHPTLTSWTDPEDSIWTSGSLPISLSPSVVPLPVSSPLTVPSPVATPAAVKTEGFLTELRAQVEMQGGLIRDHALRLEELSTALFERYDRDIGELFTRSRAIRDEIFSQRYRFRSLEYEQEKVAVTFRAIWRLVLALESWAGQTDAQRAALWHVISDKHGKNPDLWLQLIEERCARL
ncbi:hypothetical protein Tco_0639456, partial [Tanacetum coccineum]